MSRIEQDQQVLSVKKTMNYDQFQTMPGNRKIHEGHLSRLIRSFSKNHFISPIIVNENRQVIDGQHRLLASMRTEKPVYYIVIAGYNTEAMQVLNTNSTVWNKYDYLNHYCEMGVAPYLEMREFMEEYPDFTLTSAQAILSGVSGDTADLKRKYFQEGNFQIKDINLAIENANKIIQFKDFYSGFSRTVFVRTMLSLFKNSNYIQSEMIHKLSLAPTKLVHCTSVNQYLLLLEEIYNYRLRNKVNLRYATT